MVGKEPLFSLLKTGLSSSRSSQTEVVAFSKILRVVRFAKSQIHQPMEERDVSLFVRILEDGKLGFASMNSLRPGKLRQAVQKAKRNAFFPRDLFLPQSFAMPLPAPSLNHQPASIASTSTETLEKKVQGMLRIGEAQGVAFSGVFWTLSGELAVMNSNGVKLYAPWNAANCQTVAAKGNCTGFSAQASSQVSEIQAETVGQEAFHGAGRFSEAVELPAGDYPCLLSEYAVGELLMYLAYMAFSASSVIEGRSILAVRKGKKVADSSVTLCDDALSPFTFTFPFDVEGVPKRKVVFINQGMAQDVVYDLATASRFQTESTGHALPLDYSEGPIPLHLEMKGGESSEQEMLKRIKRGLYVTRFHYIREVHPLKTMVTGMTRDGVFLVENGEIVCRVKNLRFTESILGAFSRIGGISRARKLLAGDVDSGFPMAILVPKIFVEKFTFTGVTP